MSLIMRAGLAHYMDTSDTSTPSFNRIGEGFTDFTESKNPKEYSRQYIDEQTERTDVIGYAPSIAYSSDVYSDDPVCQKIVAITDAEAVGEDAQVDIVTANEYEITGTATTCNAVKRTYAVIPDQKGSGVEALIYTGTLKAVSEQISGTFTPSTKSFTPAS